MTPSVPRLLGRPPALPGVGHLPFFLRDKLGFLARAARAPGPVARLALPGPVFLLKDAEDVRHVLETNPSGYEKSERLASEWGRRLSGRGLLTSTTADHPRLRRALQPAFQRAQLVPLAGTIARGIEHALDAWCAAQEVDLAIEAPRMLRAILHELLFGRELVAGFPAVMDALETRRRAIHRRVLVPVDLPGLVSPAERRLRRANAVIDAAILPWIRARRAGAPSDDFLSALVRARFPDGAPLSDRQVLDEILTLSITGFETLGDALAWAFMLVARSPDVQAALAREAREVLGAREPVAADTSRLDAASAVLLETMRLFPPTWIFVRRASRDDVLPSGAEVPAGTKIYLCPWVVHRSPAYYPEPERFDPHRFDEATRRTRPRLAYFPFGAGPRVCLGQQLATLEGVLALALVARRAAIELVPGQHIVPHPGITLRPSPGVRARVRPRAAD